MKKFFILSLVALSTLTVNAQRKKTKANTSQGNWALRLNMGYNSTNTDPAGQAMDKATDFNFTPGIGYFVSDNLEIGANILFSKSTDNYTYASSPLVINDYTTSSRTGFGVFAQKYFPVNNWFAFYGNANVGMNFGNDNYKNTTGSTVTNTGASANGYGGSLNYGFAFTPTSNVALMADVAGLGVRTQTMDPDGANNSVTESKFGFNVWRNPYNLSLVWFFNGGGSGN
jgi:hypothetical protein